MSIPNHNFDIPNPFSAPFQETEFTASDFRHEEDKNSGENLPENQDISKEAGDFTTHPSIGVDTISELNGELSPRKRHHEMP